MEIAGASVNTPTAGQIVLMDMPERAAGVSGDRWGRADG